MDEEENKEILIPIVAKRKLMIQGGSVMFAIPPGWLAKHNLKPGDSVIVVANEKLVVSPITEEAISELKAKLSKVEVDLGKLEEKEDGDESVEKDD